MRSLIIKISHFIILSASLLLTACGGGGGSTTIENIETFTLSGTISIDSRSDIDADVMDVSGLQEQNNQIETPQDLSNPVTLGGYLSGNQGTYNTGTAYDKDTKDFFRVTLLKEQQVRVTTFLANDALTPLNVNVTLHALDDALNESTTTPLTFNSARSQSMTVPNDGRYIIELSAEEDLSSPVLYTLAISQTLSVSANSGSLSASENTHFVPGELVVRLKEVNSTQTAHTNKRPSKKRVITNFEHKHQLQHQKNIGGIGSVYKINMTSNRKTLALESNLAETSQASDLNLKWQTLMAIEQLNADSDVLFAEPNYILKASTVPAKVNDPGFSRQWNLPMIEAPAAWEAATGQGVTVAVVDSGIDTNHLDLINNINFTDGYDFISDAALANDDEPGPDNNPHDTGTLLHGSHVSGIIAAQGNNDIGVAGVAYNATIMSLRALGVDNSGTNSDIASAILYAAGLTNSSGLTPTKKADIINLSLGSTARPLVLENAINAALAEGIIIVAASGNEGSTTRQYPAAFDGVIAVSSVNDNKILSNFSNHGAHIDVTAPGGTGVNNRLFDGFQDGILSTLFANEYAEYTGTSMAAPHVAAVAALMKSINSEMTNTTFAEALNNGELTEALQNTDFYGNGLINAAKAVNWALESQGESLLPASLSIYPTQLGFIDANTESTLVLNNPGTGVLSVTELSTNNDWIEIAEFQAGSVNAAKLGKYRIKVNNTVLAPNSVNSGEISVYYSIDGTPAEPIIIDVFNANNQQTDATIGSLLVSLSYADENDAKKSLVQFALVEARKGVNQYTYEFVNVPNGSYLLQAGTNNDLDASILDLGEAKGQYPHFTQTEFIQVNNENLSDLDFSVQYQTFVLPAP
jgi:serine protease